MLFDLRGRGRRNTIKIIYVSLAFLMGGGLVLFGIGGATNGGLVDAITGSDGGSATGASRYEKQAAAAEKTLLTDPRDRVAYENLIGAKVQLAGLDGNYDPNTDTFTKKGLGFLQEAADAWTKYQALDLPVDEAHGLAAKRAADAYLYLQQPEKFITAQEVVAEARNATGPYQQLAAAAYQVGQTRKGDLAAAKAIELATDEQKTQVQAAMDAAKADAAGAAATPAPVPSATTAPEATATPEATKTPAPKPKKKSQKRKKG
jgi:hypothetical protein